MAPGMSTTTSGAMGSQPILPPAGYQPEQPRSLLSFASKLDPFVVFAWGASTMLPQWGFLGPIRYAAAGYFFLGLILFSRQILPMLGRAWPLLLLPILCTLSALWAPSSAEALRKGISLGLTAIVAVYVATRVSGRNILMAYFFVELIAGVLSLIIRNQGQGALVGVYDSKNMLAINMFILYVTSLALALDRDGRPWLRMIAFIAVPISLFLIFMAKSGTTTLLVIGATAIMVGHSFIWKPMSRVPHGRMLLTVALVVTALLAAYVVIGILQIDLYKEMLAALGKDSTLTARTMLWEIAEREMQEHPWTGLGANGYWRAENGMANSITNVIMGWDRFLNFSFHNSYYENGVNYGYPGFFATAVLASWICLSSALNWFRNQSVVNSAFLVLALMLVSRTFSEADLAGEFSGTAVMMFIAASREKGRAKASLAPVFSYGRSIAARVRP